MMDGQFPDTFETQYSAKVIKDLEAIEATREAWKKLAWHHFADIDFFRVLVDVRDEILRPYVIVLEKSGVPVTVVVGRVERLKLICKLGYKTVYAPDADILYIEYGGVLGDQSPMALDAVVSEVLRALKEGEADVGLFSHLRTDSDLYRLAKSKPAFLLRDHTGKANDHWKMHLLPAYDDFLKTISSKHRYWLRRMEKLLQQDYPGKVALKVFQGPHELKRFSDDAEKIAKKSYQRGLGVGFIQNNEMIRRLELAVSQGWFRGYILYVDDCPISYWITSLYRKTLYLDSTGFDPDYRKYEPGTVLFMEVIEAAYGERDNIDNIDFGFGGALYKERFGNEQWKEASLYIFSPTIKGLKMSILRTLILKVAGIAEEVLKKTNLVQKVKTKWRKKVEQSKEKTGEHRER